jgi:DNA-binding NarL/FixJ family response regulator
MLRTMTVEDNTAYRELFKGHLLSEFPSIEVIEAANGEEAFKALASYPIDLIFMDIRLPGENGLELTKRIETEYKEVTIAMLTNYDMAEYQEAAARCGVGCFIAKDSMKWEQISAMIKCFQRAKDTLGLKPSCVRLASEGSQWERRKSWFKRRR